MFFLLSFAFKSYKDNFYNINLKTSLLKLSSLSLQNINLETSANVAVNWISDDAISYFNKINKYKDLKMKCDVTSHFLDCKISGKFSKNLDEVKDNMYKSISKAFDQYENNFTNLIDGLIKSRKELFLYVVDSYDTTIDAKSSYKSALDEVTFAKEIFLNAINQAKIDISDIEVKQQEIYLNYILVLISGLISGLFVIFLQMPSKKLNN